MIKSTITVLFILFTSSVFANDFSELTLKQKADNFLNYFLMGVIFEECDERTNTNKYSSYYADLSNSMINDLLEGIEASKKLYNKKQTGLEFEEYYKKRSSDLKSDLMQISDEEMMYNCDLTLSQIKQH